MQREEALKLIKENVKNKNLINHMVAVSVVMERLAELFKEDEEKWAEAGLLHDIDYDKTFDDPAKHSIIGAQMLKDIGVEDDIVYAVKVHNAYHGLPRISAMDKALYCTDPVTGFIVAGALIHPDKKLNSIDTEFLLKRFKEKSFAKGADRNTICACEEIGLSLEEFLDISLKAMQDSCDLLGL